MSTSNRYRLSLKSLLLGVIYLCVGLMASIKPGAETETSLLEIALHSVACALVVGLVRQSLDLRHLQSPDPQQSPSIRLALAWRIVITAALICTLLIKIAIARGWIVHFMTRDGYFYDGIYAPVVPDIAIYLAVFVATSFNMQPSSSLNWGRFPLARPIQALTCVAIATAALTEFMLVPYYTYKALAGIEHSQKPEFQRLGAYLDPQATGYWFFWAACAAMLSLCAAAALLLRALSFSRWRSLYTVLGAIFLCSSIGYGYWFLSCSWPTLAPDFAEAGLQSQWWNWIEASAVMGLAIPLTAYRLAYASEAADGSSAMDANLPFPLSMPGIVVGVFGVGLCGAAEIVTAYFDNSIYMQSVWKRVWWLLTDLNVYLPLAVTLVFMRLLWMGIRGMELQAPIPMIDTRKFAWTCVVLAVLIPVAIPTIMAFSFSMWLSPWMR